MKLSLHWQILIALAAAVVVGLGLLGLLTCGFYMGTGLIAILTRLSGEDGVLGQPAMAVKQKP